MKAFTIFCAAALSAAATNAWSVNFHTRSNIGWTVHGTRDVTCNTLDWPSGKPQEDVEYINFDAATTAWPDPDNLIVYPGSHCGTGGVHLKPGVSKPGKGFLVGSYAIN